jgi:hypothetical protein
MSSGKKPQQESYYNVYRPNSEAAKGVGKAGTGYASEDPLSHVPHVQQTSSSVAAHDSASEDETPASTAKGKKRSNVQQTASSASVSDSNKETGATDEGKPQSARERDWGFMDEGGQVLQQATSSIAATAAGERKPMMKVIMKPKETKTKGEGKK